MEGLLKTDIPSKLSGSRQNLPWINTELKRQIRRKGRRFSIAKKSGLKEDWDHFIAIEKDVKRNLKKAESNFLETIFRTGLESGDTKPLIKREQFAPDSGSMLVLKNKNLTFDSLTGSWSVWPHVLTPQWLIKKNNFLPIYVITLVKKK